MVTDQPEVSLLTPEMIERLQAAVLAIARGGRGFGHVVIVIEKGEPRRMEITFDEWLITRN